MPSIFLSHSHRDRDFARKVSERLRAHGIGTWIDEAGMKVGDSLIERIEIAIRECRYLGVILSPSSVASEWVKREVNTALTEEIQGRTVKVLPLLYGKCDVPPFLADKVYADFTESFEEGFRQLLARFTSEYVKEGRKAKSSLLISDGTQFAAELGAMAQEAGFRLVTASTFLSAAEIEDVDDQILEPHELLILVRGHQFTRYGIDSFYSRVQRFVSDGGSLFATSWVSWETKHHAAFAGVLPFLHVRDTFEEDVVVACGPTASDLGQWLFPSRISYRTSLELLQPAPGSTVLLQTDNGVPIFGYRRFGSGLCYYLNTCQHSCLGPAESPFQDSSELRRSFHRVLEWIYTKGTELE